jgi:hypothetical protein
MTDKLQWLGAIVVIVAQLINSLFLELYPYNIMLFTLGSIIFLVWAILVKNKPQAIVNIVILLSCLSGLFKAYT